ncbi:MAG TPA: hypothetical protein VM032_07315 [Vicinamibacterales bacterium]|nr:hypothetical protein [Vicinamibacterales bacterium]
MCPARRDRPLTYDHGAMYANVLLIHSWLRWFTLLMCVGAIVYAARPVRDDSTDLPGKTWDTYLMLAVDLQMLTGLILYFGLSDFTRAAMENVGTAWSEPSVRYWSILHAGAMFGSLLTVRVARVLALNAATPQIAQRRRLVWFVISTVVILVAIPWPGLANARPLFRW